MIIPGTREHFKNKDADWIIIDMGFAKSRKSCGLLLGDPDKIEPFQFGEMVDEVAKYILQNKGPFNLMIEAPLSVAFTENGNPVGRRFEKDGKKTRYWYVGAGAAVMTGATYLLREIFSISGHRDIRLFEGFVSFKEKGTKTNHVDDVYRLYNCVLNYDEKKEDKEYHLIDPNEKEKSTGNNLVSAFKVTGMDFGIPLVIMPRVRGM